MTKKNSPGSSVLDNGSRSCSLDLVEQSIVEPIEPPDLSPYSSQGAEADQEIHASILDSLCQAEDQDGDFIIALEDSSEDISTSN